MTHRKGVGFFYYAGHGARIAGENYLVPVDAATGDESSLKQSAVSASLIVDAAAAAEDTLNILVLDACRDNPLGSTRVRGLSRIDRATGCSYPFPRSQEQSLSTGTTATAPTPSTWRWRLRRPASIWRACSREP